MSVPWMAFPRRLRIVAVAMVVGVCLLVVAYRQHREAQAAAEEWVGVFRNKQQDLVPAEARALADLAERSYAQRRSLISQQWRGTPWPFHRYLSDPTFLITQWRLNDMRRFAADLSRLECVVSWMNLDFAPSVCAWSWVELEPSPEKALRSMRMLAWLDEWNDAGPGEIWRLEQFQLIAERLPSRRTEIENEYVWPILIQQNKRGKLPDFADHLSPETRRSRREFIAAALIAAATAGSEPGSVAQQALLLDDIIGDDTVRRVTEALLNKIPTDGALLGVQMKEMGLLARLLNRYEVELTLQAAPVWTRGRLIESFLPELDDRHLKAACEVILEGWLAVEAAARTSLESEVNRCVNAWGNDGLRAVLDAAVSLRQDGLNDRDFSEMLAPILARLGDTAPKPALAAFWQEIRRDDFDRPWRLERTAEALSRTRPRGRGHELAAEMALLLADEPIDDAYSIRHVWSVLQDLCAVIEGAPRAWLIQELYGRLSQTEFDPRLFPGAACLAALRPEPALLAELQPVLLGAAEQARDEWTRNGAVLSLVMLAQDDNDSARRARALETALGHIRNLPYPRCDQLARLVPWGDLPTFARIVRLPNCSSHERVWMVEQLADRFDLPMDAFARPFMNVGLDLGFRVDPIRVAVWLDERGL